MKSLREWTAALAAVWLIGLAPTGAQARTGCGTVRAHGGSVDAHLVTVHVILEKGHISCRSARQAVRDVIDGNGRFHEGNSVATSYWVVAGGWKCWPPQQGLASCSRKRSRVSGHFNPD